jgi:hypothetical protein
LGVEYHVPSEELIQISTKNVWRNLEAHPKIINQREFIQERLRALPGEFSLEITVEDL